MVCSHAETLACVCARPVLAVQLTALSASSSVGWGYMRVTVSFGGVIQIQNLVLPLGTPRAFTEHPCALIVWARVAGLVGFARFRAFTKCHVHPPARVCFLFVPGCAPLCSRAPAWWERRLPCRVCRWADRRCSES